VRLVFYPGEGHGNSRAAARFDYALRTLRWLEHYLKGAGGEPPDTEIEYRKHLPWGEEEETDGKKEEPAAAEVAAGASAPESSR
jgi:hypothetical protein